MPGDNIKINTNALLDGTIVQEMYRENVEGIREQFMREVINTKDRHVREALIALGWTPPQIKQQEEAKCQ